MNKGNVKADPKGRNFRVWRQCIMVLLLVWSTMSWGGNGVNGDGLQGLSYAILAMECERRIRFAVLRFTQYAKEYSELKFLVTPVGCGTAGYTPKRWRLCSRMLLSWGMYICLSASERC